MDTRKPNVSGKKYEKYAENRKFEGEDYNFYDRFYDRAMKDDTVIEKFENFVLIENLFPYQIWDGFEVEKHLLLIPKRFTETISDFSPAEKEEYFEILSKYEARGFSIYARAAQNVRKTVKHQHTHLIILNYDRRIYWLFNITNKILWWRNFSK